MLNFINTDNQNIHWLGLTSKNLGILCKSQSVNVEMRLFSVDKSSGRCAIPLIKVVDLLSKENYEFKELAFVNII